MTDTSSTLHRRMVEAADTVTFSEQLDQEAGSVVLMNVFRFDPADKQALITAWTADAQYMKQQPGFISAQLHEGHAGSNLVFNYAVWESVGDLRGAVRSPGFAERIKQYPASAQSSPHVFRAISIPGICLGQAQAKGN